MRKTLTLTALGTAALAIGSLTATPADARPVADDGAVVAEAPGCARLRLFLLDEPGHHPVRKAHAIIGLDGPGADEEFARIQAAIADRCG